MELIILGITLKNRILYIVIRKKTCVPEVICTAELLNWPLAGHAIRQEDSRWSILGT